VKRTVSRCSRPARATRSRPDLGTPSVTGLERTSITLAVTRLRQQSASRATASFGTDVEIGYPTTTTFTDATSTPLRVTYTVQTVTPPQPLDATRADRGSHGRRAPNSGSWRYLDNAPTRHRLAPRPPSRRRPESRVRGSERDGDEATVVGTAGRNHNTSRPNFRQQFTLASPLIWVRSPCGWA